ncbi:hypothetical protein CSPX01_15833 [Colletotrichum filicis]|nr:hypothetical protein CSPX01_15833 [Colletotrichum filicis]
MTILTGCRGVGPSRTVSREPANIRIIVECPWPDWTSGREAVSASVLWKSKPEDGYLQAGKLRQWYGFLTFALDYLNTQLTSSAGSVPLRLCLFSSMAQFMLGEAVLRSWCWWFGSHALRVGSGSLGQSGDAYCWTCVEGVDAATVSFTMGCFSLTIRHCTNDVARRPEASRARTSAITKLKHGAPPPTAALSAMQAVSTHPQSNHIRPHYTPGP